MEKYQSKYLNEANRGDLDRTLEIINSRRKEMSLRPWEIGRRYGYYAIDMQGDKPHTIQRTVVTGLSKKDLNTFLSGAVEAFEK